MKIFLHKTLMHLLAIIFYFPIVILLFITLLFRPSKMVDFIYGLEALFNIWDKDKLKKKDTNK